MKQSTFERLHVFLMIIVLSLPFFILVINQAVGALATGLFVIAALFSLVFGKRLSDVRQRIWNVAILAIITLSIWDIFMSDAQVLDVGVRLVVFLSAIKLLSRAGERDDLQLFALSFLLMAATTAVEEGVTFGVVFVIYVVIGTISLSLSHFRSEVDRRPTESAKLVSAVNIKLIAVLAGMSSLMLAGSLITFLLFPRIGLGFFVAQSRDSTMVTGFSDSVELGDHGAIRSNAEVVMRIESDTGDRVDLTNAHWRTMTFDHYDGRSWSRQVETEEKFINRVNGAFDLATLHPNGTGENKRYTIYLEPLGLNLLPVLWPLEKIELGEKGFINNVSPSGGDITIDDFGDIRHTIENEMGVQYAITVGPEPILNAIGEQNSYVMPTAEAAPYLQLPGSLSPNLGELARTAGGESTDPILVVSNLKQFFTREFEYTTDLPKTTGDPVSAFLFETKKGHCEYFATSVVMLLRARGIPARLVNGFLGGEWNAVGQYWSVRQGDAHSWAEYLHPTLGWIPVDTTPATVGSFAPQQSAFSKTFDALRQGWSKWIVEYDLTKQIAGAKSLSRYLAPKGLMKPSKKADSDEPDKAPLEFDPLWILWALIAGASLVAFRIGAGPDVRLRFVVKTSLVYGLAIGATIWFVGITVNPIGGTVVLITIALLAGRFLRWVKTSGSGEQVLFDRVERAAKQNGIVRATDEGVEAFTARVGRANPSAAKQLSEFAFLYQRARFGGRPSSVSLVTKVDEICSTLKARS